MVSTISPSPIPQNLHQLKCRAGVPLDWAMLQIVGSEGTKCINLCGSGPKSMETKVHIYQLMICKIICHDVEREFLSDGQNSFPSLSAGGKLTKDDLVQTIMTRTITI